MYVLKSTICFIGMPTAGKTTLARDLGKEFDLPVIDLDEFIEQNQGITISNLWNSEGEGAFRCIERFHLLKILSHKPVLLSAGGGTPCFFDNLSVIKEYCFTIYLKTESSNLTNEMKSGKHPIFNESKNPEEKWSNLLFQRKSWYEKAHLIQNAYTIEPNVLEAVSKICLEKALIGY